MRFEHAAILSDLDGTLFNSRGEVSAEDREAIRLFMEEGGLFAVATGREPHNARRCLPDLPMNAPAIVLNGAAVYDFVRESYVSCVPMDKEAGADVLRHCQALGLPLDVQVYTDEGIFYASPLESADPAFLELHQPTSCLPRAELLEKTWIKMLFLERVPGALAPMRAYLRRKDYHTRLNLVEGTTDVVKSGMYQELLPAGVTKGSGVEALRRLPIYQGRRLFAAGDYWNDMELLAAVDVPCAPANAIEEVRAVCRHILPSHNESPIAHLIRKVIPEE